MLAASARIWHFWTKARSPLQGWLRISSIALDRMPSGAISAIEAAALLDHNILPGSGHNLRPNRQRVIRRLLALSGGVWLGPAMLVRVGRDLPKDFRKGADLTTGAEKVWMKSLTRFFALAGFAVALASCQMFTPPDVQESGFQPSNKPITVDNVVANAKLAEMAKAQHPRILATYGGEYSDPKLERMVAKVVGNLTVVSANPTQTYRITILNSPNVNAFALPGGYLYVTRGLLALANDSSELAAVIAHEMGHVTANHGLQRQQLEAEEGLATKVVSDVLGDSPTAKAALIRGKLRLAQFSRNQELQADAIGIKSIGEAGYDPYAAGRFLQSMSAYTDFRSVSGATDASLDFLATHPTTPT